MKGAPQHLFRPNFIHTPRSENADVEKDDVFEDALHACDVMMHDEGSFSMCGECAQMLDEPSLGFVIDAGEGFIEEKDLRRLGKSTGEKRPLTLAAGEIRKRPVPEITEPHKRKKRLDVFASLTSAAEGELRKKSSAARKAHGNHVGHGHGEVKVEVVALGDVRHGRFSGLKRSTEDLAGAVCRALKAEHGAQEGGLASAIGAYKRADRSPWDFEGDVVEGPDAARQPDA
jgi:hypothetical protein